MKCEKCEKCEESSRFWGIFLVGRRDKVLTLRTP